MQPLIQLHNPFTHVRISVYDDGKVYGTQKGQLLGILDEKSKQELLHLIQTNMYMFKALNGYKSKENPIIMYIRNDSKRNSKTIKITGWNLMPYVFRLLRNTVNLDDNSI